MRRLRTWFAAHKTFTLSIGFLVVFSFAVTYAAPLVSPYNPGATLDPQCAPGETNCTVAASLPLTGGTVTGTTTFTTPPVLSSMFVGSVPYIGTSGVISQDNQNFFYDSTDHRLGLGTTTPGAKLAIVSSANGPMVGAYSFGTYTAFGDSITYGIGASVPANDYVNVLGGDLGLTPTDEGVSSDMAADQESEIYQTTVNENGSQLFTYMIGTNDIDIYGNNTDQQANYRAFTMASAAWLAIPSDKKFTAQSGTPTYTGTWTNSPYYGGSIGKYSTENGDTATFTTTGTVAYIAYTELDGNAGTFSMTIDGVNEGTFTNYGQNNTLISTKNGKTYGSALARIAGLSAGTHTIVLTVTSATGAGNEVFFDWAAGNGNITNNAGGPTVVEGGILPRASVYNTPVYNAIVYANITTLHSDGLNVFYADTPDAINVNTDLIGDGVHPNDQGHAKVAAAFLAAINTIYTTSQNSLAINSSSGNSQFVLTSGGYLGIGTSNPTSPFTIQAPSSSYDFASSSALLPLMTFYTSSGIKSSEFRIAGGTNSLAFGIGAGSNLTTGASNNFFGNSAGFTDTTGNHNNFFGYGSGYSNTTGSYNNFFGRYAGYANTTGSSDTFFGVESGYANTTGNYDFFVGYQAGASNTTGSANNFFGNEAGYGNTSGNYNNFFGTDAGLDNLTGNSNNFFGVGAGQNSTTGSNNNFIGDDAGQASTTGNYNNFIGDSAGSGSNTGSKNNFIGYQAGANNTTGGNNNFLGTIAGEANTTGGNNNFLGNGAGLVNVSGNYNNFFGYQAGAANTTGSYNVFLGYQAGNSNVASNYNVFIGYNAGFTNASGINNVFFGHQAGYSNSSGSSNIVLGTYVDVPSATTSGQLNIGNVLYGTNLYQSTATISATPTATGSISIGTSTPSSRLDVTSTGLATTQAVTSGISVNNTTAAAVGAQQISPEFRWTGQGWGTTAGTSQAISFRSYVTPVQGTVPTGYLGFGSSVNGGSYSDNQLVLTTGGLVGIANTAPSYLLHVGSSTTASGIVAEFQTTAANCTLNPSNTGGLTCSSDMNLKKNITNLSDNSPWSFNNNISPASQSILDKVLALNPVDYNWNTESDTDPKHAGLIAQEVQQVFPDLVTTDPTTGLLSLNYSGLVPYTIEAIKEMNLNVNDIDDLTTDNTWRSALLNWFGDTANGIGDFVADTLHARNEICINQTCINEAQLQQILQNNGQSGTSSYSSAPAPDNTTPASGPTDDQSQSPEVTAPTITPDPTTDNTDQDQTQSSDTPDVTSQ